MTHYAYEGMMKRKQIDAKRLGTVAHYIGVVGEYFIVIFLAVRLNSVLKIPKFIRLFVQGVWFRIDCFRIVSYRLVLLASVYGGPRDYWFS